MRKIEEGLTRNRIISELTRSEHGNLSAYAGTAKTALSQDPEFYQHLIAWDAKKGQVRDAHVALPVLSLTVEGLLPEYTENALAHIYMLGPREFLRAYRFGLDLRLKSRYRKAFNQIVEKYLRGTEKSRQAWDRIALQHRRTLKELYALAHIKPSARAQRVLFKSNYPPNSVFEKVACLKDMSPVEAAGTILEYKIPFLIATGALGAKAKEPDLVLALIERMSPTEVVTNTKMLEKLGIKTVPVLKAAFDEAVAKAAKSKKNTLKAAKAAEQIKDESLRLKIVNLQEAQIQSLGGVDGNWLVLGDKSGSMNRAIDTAREISGILAKMVKGTVSLVFFDTSPRFVDVTGKTYDEIKSLTKGVSAGGGTSIGCGLLSAMERNVDIDGIAVVSDGAENTTPYLVDVYKRFAEKYGKEVPVYFYRLGTKDTYYLDRDLEVSFRNARLDIQEFDLTGGKVDFYSLPNLVATMRTNRYSLADEIFATPLLTLKDVLKED